MKKEIPTDRASRFDAEAQYWIRGLDASKLKEYRIKEKIQAIHSLLLQADNISLDILITIKNKF